MHPAIIGAIIEAVVFAAVMLYIYRKGRKATSHAERGSISIHELVAERYGFKEEFAKQKVTVENPEGRTHLKSEHRGITAENMNLIHIPFKHLTDHPDGKIIKEPDITSKSPNNPRDIDISIDRDLSTPKIPQQCYFTIDIAGGGLAKGEGELDFDFETTFSKMYCMTKEECETLRKGKPFKPEYHHFNVTHPIDTIELELEFPEGYPIETHFGVFAGEQEYINSTELRNRQACFKGTPRGGYFKIEKPLVGFRYIIYWTPPSKEKYEKFRREFEKAGAQVDEEK